ncbi:MAG: 30S ribosomal protein S16 [Bacteroidota bacterium]
MVKIRLRRIGKKKHPIYKVVAADTRSPRNGGYIEALGNYDPNVNPIHLSLKEQRVFHWLKNGAQPTDTVRSLLSRQGIWLRWSLMKRGMEESKMQAIVERWQMAQVDRSKREADRKAQRAEKKKAAAKVVPEAPATPAPEAETPKAEAPAAE